MKEQWKDIKGYKGHYQISNIGNIRSWKNGPHGKGKSYKILNKGYDKDGYVQYVLSMGDNQNTVRAHRLVLTYFDRPPKDGEVANHKNGIKDDNRINNLEWGTVSHNTIHAFENGLRVGPRGEVNGHSKLTKDEVIEIRYVYENDPNITQYKLAERYNVNQGTISRICNNKYWSHVK